MLSPWARPAWGDLRSDSERAKMAAELVGVLEANAKVVADVLEDGETLFEKTREIGEILRTKLWKMAILWLLCS